MRESDLKAARVAIRTDVLIRAVRRGSGDGLALHQAHIESEASEQMNVKHAPA